MGTGDLLRDLHRRLLPPLAGGLRRLAASGLARRRWRPRPLTVAALASVLSVTAVAVWTTAHRPPPDVGPATVARVGVVDGQSVTGYVASSRSELARLIAGDRVATRTYALVTLTAYLTPDQLARTVAGVDVAQVHTRVPLAHQQTEIGQIPVTRVPADVVAGMAEVAAERDSEATNYRSLSAKLTGDGREERRLRAVYTGQAKTAAAEAAAYRSRCSCVYAAVVQGVPAALAEVAGRPEVRAVDPAPEVSQLDQAVFLPPLPEQTGVVRSPASPAPPPSSRAEPRHDQVFHLYRPAGTPTPSATAGTVSPRPSSGSPSHSVAPSSPGVSKTPTPSVF